MSIRNRLLVSLLALWTIVWAAIALVTVERSHHEVEELLDAQLAQLAHVLVGMARVGDLSVLGPQGQTLASIGHPYETKISFQLWDGDHLMAALGAAPNGRLADRPGFSDQSIGNTRWRVFGLPCDEREQVLYAAQDYSIRQELVRYLTLTALQPILWSFPLVGLMVWLAVTDGLRSLSRLARDVTERSDRRLEPIADDEVPAEVRPLIRALNTLMGQLRQALSLERRFAADASHELRTPLAIINTHTQISRRTTDPAVLRQALDNVAQGVERSARLVTQLLALSRLGYERAKRETDSASLVVAVSEVAEVRRAAASAKGLHLDCRLPGDDACVVGVPSSMLEVLVSNLLDNAVKYTPAGGSVVVAVRRLGSRVELIVSDTGPGIAVQERERVFERFYRGPDQAEPGAGLGLSIVRRICELHGATIELDEAGMGSSRSESPGLRVRILFGEHAGAADRPGLKG